MGTAQCMKQKEKTANWSCMFPNEQITPQQSLMFVKKLVAVAVSSISYLRGFFPEYAFGDRRLEDLNLKILKDDSSCEGACQMIKWIKGCFDALERKYLRMMIIGVYVNPENPESVIETYTFKFSYTGDGGVDIYQNNNEVTNAHTSTDTKKATIRLLRTIILLTQSLQLLPDDVFMTMKLLYYDDVTPADYEPPGFQQAVNDGFRFEVDPMNVKVGDVVTPFHIVKLRIRTDSRQFGIEEAPGEVSEAAAISDTTGVDKNDSKLKTDTLSVKRESALTCSAETQQSASQTPSKQGNFQVVPEPLEDDTAHDTSPKLPETDSRPMVVDSDNKMSQDDNNSFGVRCGCGYNEDDGLMILCEKCNTWQHGVCYKITKEEDVPKTHICDRCADPSDPNLQPTDPGLHSLTQTGREAACLWRRALFSCKEVNNITVTYLAKRLGTEITVAHGLVSRLEKEGYVKTSRKKRQGKVIDKKMLEAGLKKYLGTPKEEENNAQTLLTKNKNLAESDIESIISQAEGINLTGRKNIEPRSNASEQLSNKKRNSRKRTRASSLKENCEFEICSSQEASQVDYPTHQSKKRKSSVARKAIRI